MRWNTAPRSADLWWSSEALRIGYRWANDRIYRRDPLQELRKYGAEVSVKNYIKKYGAEAGQAGLKF